MNTLYIGWEIEGMTNLEVLELLNGLVGTEIGIDDDVVGEVTAVLQVVNVRPEYLITKLEFDAVTDEKDDLLRKLLYDDIEKD